jgi:hypothetical protein
MISTEPFEDALQLAEYADVAPPLAKHNHVGGQ